MAPRITASSPRKTLVRALHASGETGVSKLSKAELFAHYKDGKKRKAHKAPQIVDQVSDHDMRMFYDMMQRQGRPFKNFRDFRNVILQLDRRVDQINESSGDLSAVLLRGLGAAYLMGIKYKAFQYGGSYTRAMLLLLTAVETWSLEFLDVMIDLAFRGTIYIAGNGVKFAVNDVTPAVAKWCLNNPEAAVVLVVLATTSYHTVKAIRAAKRKVGW